MLYPAVILEMNKKFIDASGEEGHYYKIHYKGWKKTWDEWVPQSRVLKMNEENLELQAKMKQDLRNRPSAVAARANAAKQPETEVATTTVPAALDIPKEEIIPTIVEDKLFIIESPAEVPAPTPAPIPVPAPTSTTIIPQDNYEEESNSLPQNGTITTKALTTTPITSTAKNQTPINGVTPPSTRGRKRKQPPFEDTTTTTTTNTTNNTTITPTVTNSTASTSKIVASASRTALNQVQKRARKCKISIQISNEMMVRLIDDWEWITNDYQLVPLPRPKPVNTILEEFVQYKISEAQKAREVVNGNRSRGRGRPAKNPQDEALREAVNGLKVYFNEILGLQLLYRAERQEYYRFREWSQKAGADVENSAWYGAEHLMRLLVSLPRCIEQVDMREAKAEQLRELSQDLVVFLENNANNYFAAVYENQTPEYIRLAEVF
ncbi:hypothetical protein G9A89_016206 [Geosiphon pyriformis]|nr:hypothetical protein G9A89_016206 [Geosiphon pyriformis]